MIFNDLGIYWIHRLEHHPSIYKYVHKPHHKWISKSNSLFHQIPR
jgi:lathosterol oxidase